MVSGLGGFMVASASRSVAPGRVEVGALLGSEQVVCRMHTVGCGGTLQRGSHARRGVRIITETDRSRVDPRSSIYPYGESTQDLLRTQQNPSANRIPVRPRNRAVSISWKGQKRLAG